MDIFGGHKNVQKRGVKIGHFWFMDFPIFKRNIFGEKVVQTYTLDLISLKVLYFITCSSFLLIYSFSFILSQLPHALQLCESLWRYYHPFLRP